MGLGWYVAHSNEKSLPLALLQVWRLTRVSMYVCMYVHYMYVGRYVCMNDVMHEPSTVKLVQYSSHKNRYGLPHSIERLSPLLGGPIHLDCCLLEWKAPLWCHPNYHLVYYKSCDKPGDPPWLHIRFSSHCFPSTFPPAGNYIWTG